jgi:hypothetical protein
MTISVQEYTGTSTIGTTEWSMTAGASGAHVVTAAGIYQAFIDLNALAGSDVFEFRCYETARTGDTQRVVFNGYFQGAQTEAPIAVTPTLILGVGWDMTIVKVSGTDRAINWRISKVS